MRVISCDKTSSERKALITVKMLSDLDIARELLKSFNDFRNSNTTTDKLNNINLRNGFIRESQNLLDRLREARNHMITLLFERSSVNLASKITSIDKSLNEKLRLLVC